MTDKADTRQRDVSKFYLHNLAFECEGATISYSARMTIQPKPPCYLRYVNFVIEVSNNPLFKNDPSEDMFTETFNGSGGPGDEDPDKRDNWPLGGAFQLDWDGSNISVQKAWLRMTAEPEYMNLSFNDEGGVWQMSDAYLGPKATSGIWYLAYAENPEEEDTLVCRELSVRHTGRDLPRPPDGPRRVMDGRVATYVKSVRVEKDISAEDLSEVLYYPEDYGSFEDGNLGLAHEDLEAIATRIGVPYQDLKDLNVYEDQTLYRFTMAKWLHETFGDLIPELAPDNRSSTLDVRYRRSTRHERVQAALAWLRYGDEGMARDIVHNQMDDADRQALAYSATIAEGEQVGVYRDDYEDAPQEAKEADEMAEQTEAPEAKADAPTNHPWIEVRKHPRRYRDDGLMVQQEWSVLVRHYNSEMERYDPDVRVRKIRRFQGSNSEKDSLRYATQIEKVLSRMYAPNDVAYNILLEPDPRLFLNFASYADKFAYYESQGGTLDYGEWSKVGYPAFPGDEN